MRLKYVEERFPRYFIFGECANGMVDIATSNDSIIATMSRQDAEKIIADRDAAIQAIFALSIAMEAAAPSVFAELWYKP